ncbi:hypothetical protein DRW03_35820 [Corallococcus sp. H22C18031201]|nr:hypothetical protein DRW03_35820 [Corallococcus sp. H22C18031201]
MFGPPADGWSGATADGRRDALSVSVEEFAADEQSFLSVLVERLADAVGAEFPRVIASPWIFAKLAPGASADTCAFTRGACIFLPAAMLRRFQDVALYPEGLAAALSLVAHEKIHVLQRLAPEPFHRLYEDGWGCRRVRTVEWGDARSWLDFKHLPNPDALDSWVVPSRENGEWTLTVPILAGRHQSNWVTGFLDFLFPPSMLPLSFSLIEVELEGDIARVRTDERGLPVFRSAQEAKAMGESPDSLPALAMDHPHEVAAGLFGRLVSAGGDGFVEPGATLFQEWCRAHLG